MMVDDTIDITSDVVAPVKTSKVTISTGASIDVKNIRYNEMSTIWKKAKDDPFEFNKWVIMTCATCKGVHINEAQVGNMIPKDVTDIANAILEVSGYSSEAMERIKKQMSPTTATTSGS